MIRDRALNRKVSFRKAKHKEYIAKHIYFFDWYNNLHQYSKNKVHCSCCCCAGKTNPKRNKSHGSVDNMRHTIGRQCVPGDRNWKPSDRRKIIKLEQEEQDFLKTY